jgi:hypothetical protein
MQEGVQENKARNIPLTCGYNALAILVIAVKLQ